MKKQILATLIGTSLSVSALADPTLYGKANVALQSASEGDDSKTELVSNASRIGIKGESELEGGLTAIYQAEYETFFDDGEKDESETFTQRNIYVGLKGGFGTVKAGKFDSPLKKAQKKIDLFNDLEGDIKAIVTANDNRPENIVSYKTPSMSNISATIAYIPSEVDGGDDGISAAVAFEQDSLYVAVALDQNVEAEESDTLRVVGQYTIGNIQLGAMFEEYEVEGADAVDATFISAAYKLDKIVFKAQFGQSDINVTDGETLSIGADYKLSKKVKTYIYHTQNSDDAETVDNDYTGVGIEVKF